MAVREGLVQSAIELMRRNGVAGTGVAELLSHSGVSRRSVYLNFPGGKAELIAEATRVAGRSMSALIESVPPSPNPSAAVTSFIHSWKQVVESSGFVDGCPIVAAALGRSESAAAADAAGDAFREWEGILAARLEQARVAPPVALSLATTIVAAIEGAVLLSLATRSTVPLDRVGTHLAEVVDLHVPAVE